MLQQIKQALAQKGYRVASRPFELNIIGIRTNYSQPNTFDDVLAVCYTDDKGQWHIHQWPGTTDPGTYWLRNPMNPQGTAILKPGQYVGSHAIGLHRGKYSALVQVRPLIVLRDHDRNGTPDYHTAKPYTGLYGINIHRASESGTTRTVDKYSAGCQVFANAEDFAHFMQLCQKHRSLYGNAFTYTLLASLPPGYNPAQAMPTQQIAAEIPKNALRPAR